MPASNTKKLNRHRTTNLNLFNFPSNVKERVSRAAVAVLKQGSFTPGDINLILLDDSRIRKLNKRFRNVDRKTDVISFRYSTAPLDGDIFLSKGVSKRQAREAEHAWADELAYLAIHGILHLFGHTDYTKTAKRRMFKMQDMIFEQIQNSNAKI